MNYALSIGLLCFTLYLPSAVYGQASPFPQRGLLQIDGKPSAVAYECTARSESVIGCKLIELDVWEPRGGSYEEVPDSQRACTFAAHPFEQILRQKPTDDSGEIEWVTERTPYGKCRVLRQSRFIGRKVDGGVEWEYLVEVKTLEKSEEDGPRRCSELREIEARYTWQGTQARATCNEVRFNAFCYSPDFPCLSDGPPVILHSKGAGDR